VEADVVMEKDHFMWVMVFHQDGFLQVLHCFAVVKVKVKVTLSAIVTLWPSNGDVECPVHPPFSPDLTPSNSQFCQSQKKKTLLTSRDEMCMHEWVQTLITYSFSVEMYYVGTNQKVAGSILD
jgi:hypothetical protein